MDLNTPENREILIKDFEKLASDSAFSIYSPSTSEYNCIAWAMGFDDRWVDPQSKDYIHKKWWPDSAPCDLEPTSLVKAFEQLGFQECQDGAIENGYDKVALYKGYYFNQITQRYEDRIVWTHAARIVGDNLFHSKIGELFDIMHSGEDVFEGSPYGTIFMYMRRSIADRSITERIKREQVELPSDEDKERIARKILALMS